MLHKITFLGGTLDGVTKTQEDPPRRIEQAYRALDPRREFEKREEFLARGEHMQAETLAHVVTYKLVMVGETKFEPGIIRWAAVLASPP